MKHRRVNHQNHLVIGVDSVKLTSVRFRSFPQFLAALHEIHTRHAPPQILDGEVNIADYAEWCRKRKSVGKVDDQDVPLILPNGVHLKLGRGGSKQRVQQRYHDQLEQHEVLDGEHVRNEASRRTVEVGCIV